MPVDTKGVLQPAIRFLLSVSLSGVSAFAQAVSYPNFSSTAGLTLKGTAIIAGAGDNKVLRLTEPKCCSAGSAFTTNVVPFQIAADIFSTFFQFRITNTGGIAPADGIVFVLRDAGTPGLGGTGANLGYDGIGKSVGVKFDTYRNDWESDDNHVAIQTNGIVMDEDTQNPYHVTKCVSPAGVTGCMANGDLWSVWIDYDGTAIHVALADNSTTRPQDLIVAPLSIPGILNYTSGAHVGFTAATGGGVENHDIVSWQYFSTYSPTPVGTEQIIPATLIGPH